MPPGANRLSDNGCRPQIRFVPAQPKCHASPDLNGLQIPQRMEIQGSPTQKTQGKCSKFAMLRSPLSPSQRSTTAPCFRSLTGSLSKVFMKGFTLMANVVYCQLNRIETLLASTISANGIGAIPPSEIALTNAAAQAFCPLSWRHRFMLLKPGQA